MLKKLLLVFTAACLLFINTVSVYAQETANELSPPQLHSAAGIVMDADTGQVLYGQNIHTQLYPASITKIVTLLLAMEKGDPNDIVTMTDEGVFSVPRGTTHIALTTGEKIRLEQLEYAMMVESANDAANGIAIHLAGSIEKFAQMMNEKAQEIGAVNSHFTNANGLPDSGHYTTVYDMALFTKEAMEYPQFASLAGTLSYEIPSTNKQPETRILSNRQYMLWPQYIYEGAFAGKTGWTEEAAKTLVTCVERDGVKLICVVMKSKGIVDAEFVDSTNLLDYCYDNFHRETIPKTAVQPKTVELTGEDGEPTQQILGLEEDMQVMLPAGLTAQQLTIEEVLPQTLSQDTVQQAKVILSAPKEYTGKMDLTVGEFPLVVQKQETPVAALQEETPQKEDRPQWFALGLAVLKWGATAIILIGILLFAVRIYVKARRRKMRKVRLQKLKMRTRAAPIPRPLNPAETLPQKKKPKIEIISVEEE